MQGYRMDHHAPQSADIIPVTTRTQTIHGKHDEKLNSSTQCLNPSHQPLPFSLMTGRSLTLRTPFGCIRYLTGQGTYTCIPEFYSRIPLAPLHTRPIWRSWDLKLMSRSRSRSRSSYIWSIIRGSETRYRSHHPIWEIAIPYQQAWKPGIDRPRWLSFLIEGESYT